MVGASVRAAVHSALRAGIAPAAIDLFADRDTVAHAPCLRIEPNEYPHGLPASAGRMPPGPWLYTGAIENHPQVVDAIAQQRPLWGNPGAILEAVRNPLAVANAMRRAGLAVPAVRLVARGLPRDGSWLVKPLASAAGRRIVPLTDDAPALEEPHYFQERIAGLPLAAVFLGTGREARLLGVTRQLLGRPGAPFAYSGSIGPWPLGFETRRSLEQTGRLLVREFGLVGLFGIDFVLCDDRPWLIEINPRYTASVEVLERALGPAALRLHAQVFQPDLPAGTEVRFPPARRLKHACIGKVILYADRPFTFPDGVAPPSRSTSIDGTAVADIPSPGTRFEAGDPVLTLFARGATTAGCSYQLARWLDRWRSRLTGTGDRSGQTGQTSTISPT